MTLTDPRDDDIARLMERILWVENLLQQQYPESQLTQSVSDLVWLQKIIDEGVLNVWETYHLQSLGIAFGRVLVRAVPGLDWAIVEDETGRDPVIRYKHTTLRVNVLTVISKRLERGERPDLDWLYTCAIESINKERDQCD